MRILHCLRAPVGGLFRHVRDLSREQARRGAHVGLLCDAGTSDPLTEARLADLEPDLALGINRLSMPREVGRGDLSAARETRNLAQALRAGILHGHGAKGGAYARIAAAGLSRRGIVARAFYTPHGGSLHYHPASLKGRLFMAAERRLGRMTDGLIFESAYAARTFASQVGAPCCPARIIHNGITQAELEPVTPAPDAADFVFVGELRQLKGVDLLLAAVARIRKERSCRLVIVGAGPEAATFQAEARALGLEPHVTFAGALPAREAFRLGRALVMPSRAESLPYVALEAAGAGLPLIATEVGGVPEIVAGTDTRLVPPNDSAALAEAMREVLADPVAAAARADRLRAETGRRFSVSAMVDAVMAFYGEAASQGPRCAA
jgi:glycosyltransferase involved in cell wall biosynthesis